MTDITYKPLPHIDWASLHGLKVRVEVSPNYIILIHPDGSFTTILQAVTPRKKRSTEVNGIPAPQANLDALYAEAEAAIDAPPFVGEE